ncbi:MAG: hypothetical protein ACFHX7_24520 [Pseudomonadota bacterium]
MSWDQIVEKDAFGTSGFQNLCCRALKNFLPRLVFEECGSDEKYYMTDVGVNNIRVWIYTDAVVISSPDLNIRLESRDFASPADLVQQLQKRLSNAI